MILILCFKNYHFNSIIFNNRWLPYRAVKRRVILRKADDEEQISFKTKNVIIQWEAPNVQINKEFKYLGVGRANPADYIKRYGDTLKEYKDLPNFVKDIKSPNGIVLAADLENKIPLSYELEGDVHALKFVDLEKEGLGEYKSFLSNNLGSSVESTEGTTYESNTDSFESIPNVDKPKPEQHVVDKLIQQIFQIVDKKNEGKITIDDAHKTLIRINSRMSKQFDEDRLQDFFGTLNISNDNKVDLGEFKKAFLKISDGESSD